jgi:uncharacterized protein (DUF934 family)
MSIIVTDEGFGPETWTDGYADLQTANDVVALDILSDADPTEIIDHLSGLQMIRIDFPAFGDGRGFTLARQIRLAGYKGTLRAKGHVLSDQYAMARRAGFDEVEISDELARRQPEIEWKYRADWRAHDYQARLRG